MFWNPMKYILFSLLFIVGGTDVRAETFVTDLQSANFLILINSPKEVQDHYQEKIDRSKVGFARGGLEIKISKVEVTYSDWVYSNYRVYVEITSPRCQVRHIYRDVQMGANEVDGVLMQDLGFHLVSENPLTFRVPTCY
jgi:hypothetical protein